MLPVGRQEILGWTLRHAAAAHQHRGGVARGGAEGGGMESRRAGAACRLLLLLLMHHVLLCGQAEGRGARAGRRGRHGPEDDKAGEGRERERVRPRQGREDGGSHYCW